MAAIKIGQTVETSGGQQGIVRYFGPIHVSEGTFVGIELSSPIGKNDGSVRGERYFSCPPAHGLFVKDTSVSVIAAAPPPASAPRSRPPPAAPRARPSSVVAPRTAPRVSTINKRQSVAPISSHPTPRAPTRNPSTTSSSTATTDAPTRQTASGSRPSISSSTTPSITKTSRDANVDALQTKIRHLEKQHAEDQERLRELAQTKDERDRFHGIIQKLQDKCQTFHQNITELKATVQNLQVDNDRLSKDEQEHETDLELATLDKEMAEERAEQAEAEIESLRKRLEERDLEYEILRDEAQMYTTEMSEEEKQEAGYYRLQHENERLRHALVVLREVTEAAEQDLKARISELETDVTRLETLEQESVALHEHAVRSDSIIEDLREQLNAANEWEDIIEDLSAQNQQFKEAITQKDMAIQDLENLKELNDELELQRAEEADDLRAELEAKDYELAEQNTRLTEQATIITDNEDIINKFRALIVELQSKMVDAESSKLMTQAQVNDTTGRFNEVMDTNRRLRAATVQATNKEISADLKALSADEALEKLEIWIETGSKEFGNSESLQAYFTAKRVAFKCHVLRKLLVSTNREMGHGGRPEKALSKLSCSKAISHLSVLKNGSEQLWSAITVLSLAQFGSLGSVYEELLTIEKALDQGLNALKIDEIDFAELAGSFGRSTRIQEAILTTHQTILAARPEDELMFRVKSIFHRLEHITSIFDLINYALHQVRDDIGEQCERTLEHIKEPADHVKVGFAAAEKLMRTLQARKEDGMYPVFPTGLESVVQQDEELVQAVEALTKFASQLIDEIAKYSSLPEPSLEDTERTTEMIAKIDVTHIDPFYNAGLHGLYIQLRHWTDLALVLMNNVEIEPRPTPWTQKAREVEAAQKKTEDAARQLDTLTSEHRVTVLKIHEREQVIATKELEIEHLLAKNRDITTKTQEFERLRDERDDAHAKIMQLEAQDRAQEVELEALRERLDNSDLPGWKDTEPATENTTAGAEPVEQAPATRTVPASHIALLAALRDDNRWLRRRAHSDIFHRNLGDLLASMESLRSFGYDSSTRVKDDDHLLDTICLTDDDSDDLDTDSNTSSPAQDMQYSIPDTDVSRRPKMSALALTGVRMGWEGRAHSHRVALEEAEEDFLSLSMIHEDDEGLY